MIINHHLDEATIVSLASGALPAPFAVVAEAHLSLCRTCQARKRKAEAIGGILLEEAAPAGLSDGALNNMLERLEAEKRNGASLQLPDSPEKPKCRDALVPAPMRPLLGTSLSDITWKRAGLGVGVHKIDLGDDSDGMLYMVKVEAGRTLPSHGHGGNEVTLVLSGSYTDRFGQFARGDIADLDSDVEHQPVVDPGDECICVVASEAPARFKHMLPRLFQSLVGI